MRTGPENWEDHQGSSNLSSALLPSSVGQGWGNWAETFKWRNKAFWAVPLHSITFLLRQVSYNKDTKIIQDTPPLRQCCSMFSENLFSWALPWSHLKLWAIEVWDSTSCWEGDTSGNACWENYIRIFNIQQINIYDIYNISGSSYGEEDSLGIT